MALADNLLENVEHWLWHLDVLPPCCNVLMDIVRIRALSVCKDKVVDVEAVNSFAGMALVSFNRPQVQILLDPKCLLLVLHFQLVRWSSLFVVGMEAVLIPTFHHVPHLRIVDLEPFDVKMELVVRKDNVHSTLVVH